MPASRREFSVGKATPFALTTLSTAVTSFGLVPVPLKIRTGVVLVYVFACCAPNESEPVRIVEEVGEDEAEVATEFVPSITAGAERLGTTSFQSGEPERSR